MPADNIEGFRADTIPLIRQIKSGFWRYGGNYTSNLIWYHTIGDRDRRPPDWDNAWSAMQTNDLGMDEFMTFCKLIGVEPYISVNAGFGDSHSAAEAGRVHERRGRHTHMGAQRAKNGHPAPYHVKFWNIGNEPWGSWQLGRTDLKYFVLKHNEFAKAMRAVDPSITLIASGLMLEDWYLPGAKRAKYAGNLGPLYGSDLDWTGGFLKSCWGNFDGIAAALVRAAGQAFRPGSRQEPSAGCADRRCATSRWTRRCSSSRAIRPISCTDRPRNGRATSSASRRWSTRRSSFRSTSTPTSAEASAEASTLKQALAYGMIFNEMLRHTDSSPWPRTPWAPRRSTSTGRRQS